MSYRTWTRVPNKEQPQWSGKRCCEQQTDVLRGTVAPPSAQADQASWISLKHNSDLPQRNPVKADDTK